MKPSNTSIKTYSGKWLDFRFPLPEAITITDLSVVLPRIPRWGGHSDCFYSVAHHSKHVHNLCASKWLGLIHDAQEAFMCDVASPLKSMLPEYREIEDRLARVIQVALFGRTATYTEYEEMKRADALVCIAEGIALCGAKGPEEVFIGGSPFVFSAAEIDKEVSWVHHNKRFSREEMMNYFADAIVRAQANERADR